MTRLISKGWIIFPLLTVLLGGTTVLASSLDDLADEDIKRLGNESEVVKIQALNHIFMKVWDDSSSSKLVTALISALADPSPRVREKVAAAMGSLEGFPSSFNLISFLEIATHDETQKVREAARHAKVRIMRHGKM